MVLFSAPELPGQARLLPPAVSELFLIVFLFLFSPIPPRKLPLRGFHRDRNEASFLISDISAYQCQSASIRTRLILSRRRRPISLSSVFCPRSFVPRQCSFGAVHLASSLAGALGIQKAINKAAIKAKDPPNKNGAEGPKPSQAPAPCQSNPAMSEAGKANNPIVAL